VGLTHSGIHQTDYRLISNTIATYSSYDNDENDDDNDFLAPAAAAAAVTEIIKKRRRHKVFEGLTRYCPSVILCMWYCFGQTHFLMCLWTSSWICSSHASLLLLCSTHANIMLSNINQRRNSALSIHVRYEKYTTESKNEYLKPINYTMHATVGHLDSIIIAEVSRYNYITVCAKASWTGLICHTHQHYHCQWLPYT